MKCPMKPIATTGKSEQNAKSIQPMIGYGSFVELFSDEFINPFAMLGTIEAVRTHLRFSPIVRRFRHRWHAGEITEGSIRGFIERLNSKYKPGERFVGEPALCAIAVLLEGDPTEFAEDYLRQLSQAQSPEIAIARRVAGLCLARRAARPNQVRRVFRFARPVSIRHDRLPEMRLFRFRTDRRASNRDERLRVNFHAAT